MAPKTKKGQNEKQIKRVLHYIVVYHYCSFCERMGLSFLYFYEGDKKTAQLSLIALYSMLSETDHLDLSILCPCKVNIKVL